MSSSLATAFITLVPKCDVGALKKEGESAGNSFGSSFSSKLGTAAKVGAVAFAATAAAVAGVTVAIKDSIMATADYGDNVDKMSQKIGMTAKSYQEWAYVMERAGTSVDILQSGMKTLSSQAQKNASEFQKLGISEQEVATLSQEDLFGRVIEGLSGMEEGTERTALATTLLGKSATELAPLLNEGTDAINEQREMAEKYGLVMSDKAVKASADFKDSITTLQGAMRGLGNTMMGELLPSATQMSEGLTLIVTGDIDAGVELIANGLSEMLGKIEENLPTFLEKGGEVGLRILTGLMNKLPDILAGLGSIVISLVSKMPEYLPVILAAAGNMFVGIVRAIPPLLGGLLSALGSLISSGVSWIGGQVGRFVSAGGDLIRGLASGISGAIDWVMSVISGLCESALSKVKSFFGINSPSRVMMEMGGYIGEGLAIGIADSEVTVDDAMNGLLDSAYGKATAFEIGMASSNKATNADVVGAINMLHNDLYSIIKDASPNGITERQFGRLVRQYA